MSSVMDGVGKAVVGVWRAHTALDESDDAESSPDAPDRFRKMRSSSSLNSLRMSLRKRLPLRSVQATSLPEHPTWETVKEQPKPNAVRKLTRSARNTIGGMYQKFQRSREFSREDCLVATPGRDGESACPSASCTPRNTPVRAATPRRTPRSAATPGRASASRGRRTPEASVHGVRTGGGRRQLVRMAALRSPFASPNTQNQRMKFDQDLESVSSGLRRLKRLSKAFDNIIGRENRPGSRERSGGVVLRRLDPHGKLSCSNLTHRASRMSDTLGDWAQTAVNTIRKPN
ncbi:protein PIMREG isoform 1-T1 [Menidia menidia]